MTLRDYVVAGAFHYHHSRAVLDNKITVFVSILYCMAFTVLELVKMFSPAYQKGLDRGQQRNYMHDYTAMINKALADECWQPSPASANS